MKVEEMNSAIRRAHNIFDRWNEATGYFVKNSGYYSEILGVVEDAVHCGAQAALKVDVKLESEEANEYEQSERVDKLSNK